MRDSEFKSLFENNGLEFSLWIFPGASSVCKFLLYVLQYLMSVSCPLLLFIQLCDKHC